MLISCATKYNVNEGPTQQALTLKYVKQNQGIVLRLEADNSTEESFNNGSELLYMLTNKYASKTVIEMTNEGKIFILSDRKEIAGRINKYTFDVKHSKKISNLKNKSTPLQPLVSQ